MTPRIPTARRQQTRQSQIAALAVLAANIGGTALATGPDPATGTRILCTLTCMATNEGGCKRTPRDTGFFLPEVNRFPDDTRYELHHLAGGRVLKVAGGEDAVDTIKTSTLTFYADGTAGLVETELMHGGDLRYAAHRGPCRLATED